MMNRRRFVFENGNSLSTPLRRTGAGPVSLEMSVWTLQGGSLDMSLLESSEGTDWSVVADWRGNRTGWAHFGLVTPQLPWLRALLRTNAMAAVLADVWLIESTDAGNPIPSHRKEA